MTTLLLLAVLCVVPVSVGPTDDASVIEPVLYLVVDTTPMRSAPHSSAPTVRRLKRYEVLAGRETVSGWLRVEAASVGEEEGWIAIERDNVLRGPLEALKRRLFRVQESRWPDRVKLDVVRGRIRQGFTADQVRLALGDPLTTELQQTGDSVSEAWTYDDQRILFSHTGVRAIERLPSR